MSADPRRSLTLYFRGLPGPRSITLDVLSSKLQDMCSPFGNVVKIDVRPTMRYKEQAWVTFDNQESADTAKKALDGWDAFNVQKTMAVAYAKEASEATFKREGDIASIEQHKQRRIVERERRRKMAAAKPKVSQTAVDKQQKGAQAGKPAPAKAAGVVPDEFLPANKTLVVKNVPQSYHDQEKFAALWSRFPGFRGVRMVNVRSMAFVDFESDLAATAPKQELDRSDLDRSTLVVTFQRA